MYDSAVLRTKSITGQSHKACLTKPGACLESTRLLMHRLQAAQKEKKRTPAWTDRILFKSPVDAARQHHYSSASLPVSDHKPVTASLTLTVCAVTRSSAC